MWPIAILGMTCSCGGDVGSETCYKRFQARQFPHFTVIATINSIAGRNDNGGCGIELFLYQLTTEDIIPLHVGCPAKFREEWEMRRAVCHGSARPRRILNENEPA